VLGRPCEDFVRACRIARRTQESAAMEMLTGFILGLFTYRVLQLLFRIAEQRREERQQHSVPQPHATVHRAA
jgi:hypothetical protein